MSESLIFEVLASTSLAAIVGAVINGFINRRKLSAEATTIITQAAGGMVANLQEDNQRLRLESTHLKAQVDKLEITDRRRGRRDDLLRRALQIQADYSKMCAELLREAGIIVPDPPVMLFDFDDDSDVKLSTMMN